MRRLLLVVLLVLLPLRGWAADVMAIGLSQPASTTVHALCPDHVQASGSPAAGGSVDDGEDATAGQVHAHCTACQLPAMALHNPRILHTALPAAPMAAPLIARAEPAPQRLIKPPIT